MEFKINFRTVPVDDVHGLDGLRENHGTPAEIRKLLVVCTPVIVEVPAIFPSNKFLKRGIWGAMFFFHLDFVDFFVAFDDAVLLMRMPS